MAFYLSIDVEGNLVKYGEQTGLKISFVMISCYWRCYYVNCIVLWFGLAPPTTLGGRVNFSESLLMIGARRGVGEYFSESLLVIGARRGVGVYVSESLLVIGARKGVGVHVSETLLVIHARRGVGVHVS